MHESIIDRIDKENQ
jgi:hypothetical protein